MLIPLRAGRRYYYFYLRFSVGSILYIVGEARSEGDMKIMDKIF